MKWLIEQMVAGCAVKPPTTQNVPVPVRVACVGKVPAAPVCEFDKLTPTASDGEKVLAPLHDWLGPREYEGERETVVAGCR